MADFIGRRRKRLVEGLVCRRFNGLDAFRLLRSGRSAGRGGRRAAAGLSSCFGACCGGA
jgi:hypothetical protein